MSMCKELLSRKIHQKLFDLDLYVNIVQSYKLLNYDSTTPSYLKCDSSATLELFKYSLLINHFFCFLDLLVRIQSSKFHIKVMSTFSVSINQTFMSNHIMIHQKLFMKTCITQIHLKNIIHVMQQQVIKVRGGNLPFVSSQKNKTPRTHV